MKSVFPYETLVARFHDRMSEERLVVIEYLLRDLANVEGAGAVGRLEEYSGLIERWRWLRDTPYEELPEDEKTSVRLAFDAVMGTRSTDEDESKPPRALL